VGPLNFLGKVFQLRVSRHLGRVREQIARFSHDSGMGIAGHGSTRIQRELRDHHMFNVKKLALSLAIAGTALTSTATAQYGKKEGGYVGSYSGGYTTVVYNFLKHFNHDQYYWSREHMWETSNDYFVDAMDIAIFGGYGNKWFFVGTDNKGVDLRYVSNGPDDGFGDCNSEFVAFQSSKVVPAPPDSSLWAYNWTRSSGAFEGLHQAMGFRTHSYQSTDQDVTNVFGIYTRAGYGVFQSWFHGIALEAHSYEFGSAVMYPTAWNDTYYSFIADPPANSTWLSCWYQH